MYKTIGILTGGGDAPGLNAVIRAVVKTASGQYGMNVIGIEDGFEGLLGETRCREAELSLARAIGAGLLSTQKKVWLPLRERYTTRPSIIFLG
jgi:6-phosphofructokinase 1